MQVGGSFHPWNLYELLSAQYKNKELPSGFEFIDEHDENLKSKDLFVWCVIHPQNCHIIIMHRGTKGLSDWGNNLKILGTHFPTKFTKGKTNHYWLKRFFSTERAIRAANVHIRLNNRVESIIHDIKHNENIIDRHTSLYKCVSKFLMKQNLNNKSSTLRKLFIKTHLSTIGHSQGALYCYVYGDEGFETIVINPAPIPPGFHYPSNLYVCRNVYDPISMMGMSLFQDVNTQYEKHVGSQVRILNFEQDYDPHTLKNLKVNRKENKIRIGNDMIFEKEIKPTQGTRKKGKETNSMSNYISRMKDIIHELPERNANAIQEAINAVKNSVT